MHGAADGRAVIWGQACSGHAGDGRGDENGFGGRLGLGPEAPVPVGCFVAENISG
jgi:hypothetical protein